MPGSTSAAPPTLTSRELCQRAISAHEHLYGLIGYDEPDLGINVTFVLGRAKLRSMVSARVWTVEPDTGAATLALIEAAEREGDPIAACDRLGTFADEVILSLRSLRAVGPRGQRPAA